MKPPILPVGLNQVFLSLIIYHPAWTQWTWQTKRWSFQADAGVLKWSTDNPREGFKIIQPSLAFNKRAVNISLLDFIQRALFLCSDVWLTSPNHISPLKVRCFRPQEREKSWCTTIFTRLGMDVQDTAEGVCVKIARSQTLSAGLHSMNLPFTF